MSNERKAIDVLEHSALAFERMRDMGLLVNSVGSDGVPNTMTIGWWLLGYFYHGRPVSVVAIRPACHTFKLLDEVGEFVISIPDETLREACAFCGRESGRSLDKFKAMNLTCVPSVNVQPPSIRECPINIECRIYHKERPPHMILTPEHRQAPLEARHTIYFAEVLGTYCWEG